jgi:hypothetical protein
MDLKLPKSTQPVVIELRRGGYQTLKESVVPDVDQRLRLSLALAPRATTTTAVPATSSNPYHRFE